jgi:hypothetical protein
MTAYVRKAYDSVKNILHLGQMPPRFWGPRFHPAKPIGKSGTDYVLFFANLFYWSLI